VRQHDRQKANLVAAGIPTAAEGLIAFFAKGDVISQADQDVNP
jgi:hypothetical protein